METEFIQVLTAGAGAAGFSILYGLRRKFVPVCAVGGALCWLIYLIVFSMRPSVFFAGIFSGACTAVFAEFAARIFRAPSTIFFVPSVIPLVPGGPLYYAISYAIQGKNALAWTYAARTAWFALSIAAGASVVWAVLMMFRRYRKRKGRKNV